MAQKQVGLRLDPGTLERIDEVRGSVPRNRWIGEALVGLLDALEVAEAQGSTPPVVGGRQTTVEEQAADLGPLATERLTRFAGA